MWRRADNKFPLCHFGVGFRKSHFRIAWDFSFFSGPPQTFSFTAGYYDSWYVTDRDRLFRDAWSDDGPCSLRKSLQDSCSFSSVQVGPALLSTLCVYKDLLYSFYVFTTHYNSLQLCPDGTQAFLFVSTFLCQISKHQAYSSFPFVAITSMHCSSKCLLMSTTIPAPTSSTYLCASKTPW